MIRDAERGGEAPEAGLGMKLGLALLRTKCSFHSLPLLSCSFRG